MFGLIGLLTAAASIVGALYVFQVVWPRVRSALRDEEQDPAQRARRLLRRYRARSRRDPARFPRPDIHFVRSARKGADFIVLLVNRGGPALNLRVESQSGAEATIEPNILLASEGTGSLWLAGTPGTETVSFTILYDDAAGLTRRRGGRCRVSGEKVVVEEVSD